MSSLTFQNDDSDDNCSEVSSVVGGGNDGSIVSTNPDKYGFIGGQQYRQYDKKELDRSVLVKRERKWTKMFDNWNDSLNKDFKRVRERCRKGIPPAVRPAAWYRLCGGQLLCQAHPGYFEQLLQSPGDQKCIEDIKKDINRQYPFHEMFANQESPGQENLFNILKAYSIVNPKVGYCQAQAPIAAFLLIHLPAEHAFWCLYAICEKYLKGYYNTGMEMIQLDGDVLFSLLGKVHPDIHRHLKKQNVEPILYMTEWFLCAFTRTLPWETLLRIWDIFLCEGVKVLFKVALVVIKICLPHKSYSKLKKTYPSMYETLEALRHPPQHLLLDEDAIVLKVLSVKLTGEDIRYVFETQRRRRIVEKQKSEDAAKKLKIKTQNESTSTLQRPSSTTTVMENSQPTQNQNDLVVINENSQLGATSGSAV